MKLRYITIEKGDNFEIALRKVKMAGEHTPLYLAGMPQSLMGNAKILELYTRALNTKVKVDGPGFIIDELFNYYS